MIRTQIELTEDQSQILKTIALKQGVSVAELIRWCIDSYVRSINQPMLDEKRQRALSVVGIASSGVRDLSTNHDHYLAETYGDFGK